MTYCFSSCFDNRTLFCCWPMRSFCCLNKQRSDMTDRFARHVPPAVRQNSLQISPTYILDKQKYTGVVYRALFGDNQYSTFSSNIWPAVNTDEKILPMPARVVNIRVNLCHKYWRKYCILRSHSLYCIREGLKSRIGSFSSNYTTILRNEWLLKITPV